VPYPVTWLDVFTDRPLTGNQLAVVHDTDALDDATLQLYARETRLSETTFVQTASTPDADYRNRIFDPRNELPLAGHPSLGTAVAVAHRRGDHEAHYVQQTPSGLQPVDVAFTAPLRARASMLQEPAEFGGNVAVEAVAAAAGLEAGDFDPQLPPRPASTGYRHLLAFVRDPSALGRSAPRLDLLASLLDEHGCGVLTLAAFAAGPGRLEVRAFFPAFGTVLEDPATGSAAGALCAHLFDQRGTERLQISQGAAMGRPSVLLAEIAGDRVRVSGDVVVLGTGELNL
jgi:trans-2,3-dihydro-3-hydroxyanthranilate isomerase